MSYAPGSFNKWRGLNVTVDLIFEFFAIRAETLGLPTWRGGAYIPHPKKKK